MSEAYDDYDWDSFLDEPVTEPEYVFRDINEVIAGTVEKAKIAVSEFISMITANHINEMFGGSGRQFSGSGIMNYKVEHVQNFVDYRSWQDPHGVMTRIPTKYYTRLVVTGDLSFCNKYADKILEVADLSCYGIPGYWSVRGVSVKHENPVFSVGEVILDRVANYAKS